MLIVLALTGLASAIMVPSIQRTLASNADHRETFHFQRLLMDLRATAFHEERALQVVDTGDFKDDDPDADPAPAEIKLDEGWSYKLSGPMTVTARGLCDGVSAELAFQGQPRVKVTTAADCTVTAERIG